MADGDRVVDRQALQDFTARVFTAAGMTEKDAAVEAEVLVWANLRGVDSHGVQRIEEYLARVDEGNMNPKARIQVLKESPAVLYVEADHAFGPVVTVFTMEKVMTKAREVGLGWALIRNTTHQGAMGYYVEMAAKAGLAGIAMVCNPPNMAPWGATARGVHNSPIAIGVPGKDHRPLILDMATSIAAGGKVQVAVDKGISIPDSWALDEEGRPTTDPKQVKALRPAGEYKGSGLAMMFESLTSIMANNPLLTPTLLDRGGVRPGKQNSVVAAVDISFFSDVDGYGAHIDELVRGIKGLPRADGVDEIMMPGEPEARVQEEREENGIPLPPGTWRKMAVAAERFGLDLPAER
ncbi:Ldh family oxidoreductase [Candidatus Latescibacterota bacterium]